MQHTCVILVGTAGLSSDSGSVVCFGSNEHGQTDPPEDLGPVVELSSGHYHACAMRADGTVACWGRNNHRQTEVPDCLKQLPHVWLVRGRDGTAAK